MNQQALPDREFMYQALLNRDSQLDGIFYFGVKTTGIFCRPGCSARNPKKENVDYFASVQKALDSGYRPCKICSRAVATSDDSSFSSNRWLLTKPNTA